MKSDDYSDFEKLLLRSAAQDGLPAAKRDRMALAVCREVRATSQATNRGLFSRLFGSRVGLPIWAKLSMLLFAGTASAVVAVRTTSTHHVSTLAVHNQETPARLRPTRRKSPRPSAVAVAPAELSFVPTPEPSHLSAPEAEPEPMPAPTPVTARPRRRAPEPQTPSVQPLPTAPEAWMPPTGDVPAAVEEAAPLVAPTKYPEPMLPERSAAIAAAEVDILQKVRAALLHKDAKGALACLEEYGTARPNGGTLGEEAEILRIDAFLLAGDQLGANRTIENFLKNRPHSAKAGRLRALLATPTINLDRKSDRNSDPDSNVRPFSR